MPYQTQSPCEIVAAFHDNQNTWHDLYQIEITTFPNGKTKTIAKPLRDLPAKQKCEHQQVSQELNDEPSQEKLQNMSRELQEEKKLTKALMEQIKALEKQKDHDAKSLSVLSEEKRSSQAQLKKQQKSFDSTLQQTKKTLNEAKAKIATLEDQQRKVDTTLNRQLADARGEITALEDDLKKLQAQISSLGKERDSLKQSKNDLLKKNKLDTDKSLMRINELEDLTHLQQQVERNAKATESELREELQTVQRNSSNWQLKAIGQESTIANLTATIRDLQSQDQERQLMFEEDKKINEKESLLPTSQATILGNSHQEKSSFHWGSESENGSIRDEPMQDTLPPSSLRETQIVEDNASQEDEASFSQYCITRLGHFYCHLKELPSDEVYCPICNSALTVCEKCNDLMCVPCMKEYDDLRHY